MNDIERRVAAVVTAFRAETQIELSGHSAGTSDDVAEIVDPAAGELAQWCGRHESVLAQHGLYVEAEKGGDRCRFSRAAPADHQRVTWTEAAKRWASAPAPLRIEDDDEEL